MLTIKNFNKKKNLEDIAKRIDEILESARMCGTALEGGVVYMLQPPTAHQLKGFAVILRNIASEIK